MRELVKQNGAEVAGDKPGVLAVWARAETETPGWITSYLNTLTAPRVLHTHTHTHTHTH